MELIKTTKYKIFLAENMVSEIKNRKFDNFVNLYKTNIKINNYYKNEDSLYSDLAIINSNLLLNDITLIYQFTEIVLSKLYDRKIISLDDKIECNNYINHIINEVINTDLYDEHDYMYTEEEVHSLILDSYKYHSYFFNNIYPQIEDYSHLQYISLYQNTYVNSIDFLNQYLTVKINDNLLIDMKDYNFINLSNIYKIKNYLKNLINIRNKVF